MQRDDCYSWRAKKTPLECGVQFERRSLDQSTHAGVPPGNGHQKFRRLVSWSFKRSDRYSGPGGNSPDFPTATARKLGAVACRAHSDRLGFLYLQPHNRAKPQRFQPVSCCVARYHLLPEASVAQTPRTLQNCLLNATYLSLLKLHPKEGKPAY
jgi:hypothetical protein